MICSSLKRLPFIARLLFSRRTLPQIGGVVGVQARWSEGGPMCVMFSATYPQRPSSLVLYGTFASFKDPPRSMSKEKYEEITSKWVAHWGEGTLVELNIPSAINDEAV